MICRAVPCLVLLSYYIALRCVALCYVGLCFVVLRYVKLWDVRSILFISHVTIIIIIICMWNKSFLLLNM